LNTKTLGNVAMGKAVAHFTTEGYFVFTPFGDNTGAIDLVVSPDGIAMYRVQCKHTTAIHSNILAKTGKKVYHLLLRGYVWNNDKGSGTRARIYTETSFDILFASTPERNWLIDWKALSHSVSPFRKTTGAPTSLVLGKRVMEFEWILPAPMEVTIT
jgi:PD-(D/E)XK endonuclease